MAMHRFRRNCLVGCALTLMVFSAPRAGAEESNTEKVENETGVEQTELEVELLGDQTGHIENYLNPFGSGGTETATFNSTSNKTTIEFSVGTGGTPVEPGESAVVGIEEENPIELVDKGWTPTEELPAPTMETHEEQRGGYTEEVIIEAEVEQAGGLTSQEFTELLLNHDAAFEVQLENDVPLGPELTFTDVKYYLSPTLIPLDQLNSTDLPPTLFAPVPGLTGGTSVDSGQSADSAEIVLPEPACLTLIVGAGLLAQRRRGLSHRQAI